MLNLTGGFAEHGGEYMRDYFPNNKYTAFRPKLIFLGVQTNFHIDICRLSLCEEVL